MHSDQLTAVLLIFISNVQLVSGVELEKLL